MGGAAAGEQSLLDALAVGEQADPVAREEGELGKSHGRGRGVVELGVGAGLGGVSSLHSFSVESSCPICGCFSATEIVT